jgi:NAD(P)-dependent dehydrogenase (short-subunit alcohol dehydrogenase family)
LITGCSSGLGRALAEAAASVGDRVLATARRPETLDRLRDDWPDRIVPAALDIRDPEACAAAVGTARDRLGGLDVVVHNAGYGLFGAVEEVSDAELRDQFETVVFGTWRLTREVLPMLRAQGGGRLLIVSSVAGRMAFPGLGAYTSAKFALEGMAETLALELAGTGVGVTLLEPGGFATSYGRSVIEAAARVPAYAQALDPMLEGLRGLASLPTAGRPWDFAAAVLRFLDTDHGTLDPPLRLPVGEDAWELLLDAAERHLAETVAAAHLFRRQAGEDGEDGEVPAGAKAHVPARGRPIAHRGGAG